MSSNKFNLFFMFLYNFYQIFRTKSRKLSLFITVKEASILEAISYKTLIFSEPIHQILVFLVNSFTKNEIL